MHGGMQTEILILPAKTHSFSGCTVSKSSEICQLNHGKLNPTLCMHCHVLQQEFPVVTDGAHAKRLCPVRIQLNANGQEEGGCMPLLPSGR